MTNEITRILQGMSGGDLPATEKLLPLVYDELRKLAARKMVHEQPGQTLQPTALVHEAWLRVAGENQVPFENRAHFFAAAAEAMRRILIDRARRRKAAKHGGLLERVQFDELDVIETTQDDDRMLAVHDALDKFAEEHAPKAELVKLRYFAGMTIDEAAQALNISAPTAKRWWVFAKAWLYREIEADTSKSNEKSPRI